MKLKTYIPRKGLLYVKMYLPSPTGLYGVVLKTEGSVPLTLASTVVTPRTTYSTKKVYIFSTLFLKVFAKLWSMRCSVQESAKYGY